MRNQPPVSSGSPKAQELEETILAILPFPEPEELFNRIRARHPKSTVVYYQLPGSDIKSVEHYRVRDVDVPLELYERATIVLTMRALPLPSQAPRLKLAHLLSVGIDHIVGHPLYTSRIPITTSRGISAPQIAEHVFMTLLSLTHHLPTLLSWQREHRWGSHSTSGGYFGTVNDLVGKTLGILGYGAVGRQAGRVAKALGMRVLVFTAGARPTPESRRDSGYIVPGTGDPDGSVPDAWFSGLDAHSRREFLRQGIDVLLVAVPLTDDTRHFLAAEEFAILERPRPAMGGRGAYVVNIARGPVIDHDALLAALKRGLQREQGGLAGASLDVTEPEPLPETSELWRLRNVIVTPHISSAGSEYKERCIKVMELNLERMERGLPLLNEVCRSRGY